MVHYYLEILIVHKYDVTFDSGSTFDVSESNNIFVNNLSTDVTLQYDSKTLSLILVMLLELIL